MKVMAAHTIANPQKSGLAEIIVVFIPLVPKSESL
jgi:hypothetical protein